MEKICYGIRKDLQADVRHEPNACDGYVLDLSLGCAHQCNYCIFSPLERKIYRLIDPSYKDQVIPLKLDRFMARKSFPPVVYMCYASDPLAGAAMRAATVRVLKKLFEHEVRVLFITKGRFTDEVLDVIGLRPDLMEIQVGIASCDGRRNRLVEPGVPDYSARLANFENLAAIEGLGSLVVRMDPLFPNIDDTPENVDRVLADVSALGVREAVFGYVTLTANLREQLKGRPELADSMRALSEKTPTISNRPLYSFPFAEKVKRLHLIQKLCAARNITMAVCGCKDERLKTLSIPWVCHPFKRREARDRRLQAGGGWESGKVGK
jgi:DNA repair photolyase